jgi:hypothetical protein
MESKLKIRLIGNYKVRQAEPEENCKVCNNVEFADVLIEGVCGKCLLHHYDSTKGLFVTDILDKLLQIVCDPEDQPHQFVGKPEEIRKIFFWRL